MRATVNRRNSGSPSHRRRLPPGSRLPRGYPAARARSYIFRLMRAGQYSDRDIETELE